MSGSRERLQPDVLITQEDVDDEMLLEDLEPVEQQF